MKEQGLTMHEWKQVKELLIKANDQQLSEIRRQCLTEGWKRQEKATHTIQEMLRTNKNGI